VQRSQVDTEELGRRIASRTSLSDTDVLAFLHALRSEIEGALCASDSVRLDGSASFLREPARRAGAHAAETIVCAGNDSRPPALRAGSRRHRRDGRTDGGRAEPRAQGGGRIHPNCPADPGRAGSGGVSEGVSRGDLRLRIWDCSLPTAEGAREAVGCFAMHSGMHARAVGNAS